MIDQSRLMECMEEIKSIGVAQQGKLTQKEIQQYLSDMELTSQQLTAVYQYLGASQIEVEGYEYIPEIDPEEIQSREATAKPEQEAPRTGRTGKAEQSVEKKLSESKTVSDEKSKAEKNLEIYRQELSELEMHSDSAEVLLFERYLEGESSLRNQLVEGRLTFVHDLAGQYSDRKVSLDDVIAEGNMGLMIAMNVLEENSEHFILADGTPDMEKILNVIETEVKQSIECMIDDTTSEKDWEHTILAKANLLHEAAKYLANEMGRVATQEELSKYTMISMDEIKDIMSLSEKDGDKIAKP